MAEAPQMPQQVVVQDNQPPVDAEPHVVPVPEPVEAEQENLEILKRKYEELKNKVDSLTKSSVDTLLTKIRNLASRPSAEFSRFEAMDILEAIKNSAQDNQHEKANYYRLTYETLRSKLHSSSNEKFRAFLLPLLGDKDQEKILDIVAKVEKNDRRQTKHVLTGASYNRVKDTPYRSIRCFYCQKFGHTKATCFKLKRDKDRDSSNQASQSK